MELTMDVIRQCAQAAIQNKPFVIDALECEILNMADDLANVDSVVSDLCRSEDAIYHMHDDTKSALGSDLVVELNRLLTPLNVSRSKVADVARTMRRRVKWLKKELEKING
jgi:hypothetical protein